jgi:SH3-like domain-containing protein
VRRTSGLPRYLGPIVLAGLGVVLLLPGGEALNPASPVAPTAEATETAVVDGGDALLAPMALTEVAISSTSPAEIAVGADDAPPDETTASLASGLPETVADQPMPPDLTQQAGTLMHVGGKAVNMRAGPSKNTARLLTLQPGAPVSVKETSGGWSFVVAASGDSGWVYSTYLRDGSEPQVASVENDREPTPAKKKPVQGTTAQVRGTVVARSGPSQLSERLFVIEPGEEVTIVETRGRWARVVVDGGISGWVRLRPAD